MNCSDDNDADDDGDNGGNNNDMIYDENGVTGISNIIYNGDGWGGDGGDPYHQSINRAEIVYKTVMITSLSALNKCPLFIA